MHPARPAVRLMARTLLGVLALFAGALALPTTANAATTLTIWVSPSGNDAADGRSSATPFATLQHASDWLCGSTTSCQGRGQPVEVRIAQTVIPVTSTIIWRYFDANFPTTLEPWSLQPGQGWTQLAQTGGLPTFDGAFTMDFGMMVVPAGAGSASIRLNFTYLRWQHFNRSAIEIHGGLTQKVTDNGITVSWPTADAANGVNFYGCYFFQIGNAWHPDHLMGWGAVDVYNSSGDRFVNNHFVQLLNAQPSDAGHLHGLYLMHHSSHALVQANEFTDITGDVVRQRDLSEFTVVTGNRFTRAGQFGYVDDWYCRPNILDSVCFPKEYRSWGGRFYGNTLNGLYPETARGRTTAFCFDLVAACPANRWDISEPAGAG